jgi:transposase
VWVPALGDRALLELLLRRMHLIRLRTSAKNRIFGLLTQWGVRASVNHLRSPGAVAALGDRGVPDVWRASVAEAVAVIDLLDARPAPIDAELLGIARGDARAALLRTIPGVGWLPGLTFAVEIGDIARFPSARQLVGYSGLVATRPAVR